MDVPDLSVLVGSGCDCKFSYEQFTDSDVCIFDNVVGFERGFYIAKHGCSYTFCSPRVGVKQVLDNYAFASLLDGFVWRAYYQNYKAGDLIFNDLVSGHQLSDIKQLNDNFSLIYASFEGVEKGSIFEKWAKVGKLPIIDFNEDPNKYRPFHRVHGE